MGSAGCDRRGGVVTAIVVAPVPVDEAYRALRVPIRARLHMRWYARADRRAGLPIGLSPDTTPVLQQLRATFGDVAERERTRFFASVETVAVRLGAVSREIELAREELSRRTQSVEELSLPPAEEWLTLRYPGEDRLDASAVRSRRGTNYLRALNAARDSKMAAQQKLDGCLVEQADLRRQVWVRAEQTAGRVVRFARLIEAEGAMYRRSLVRRHPERDALIHRWTTEVCVIPAWASVEALASAAEGSGVHE
jgi:hypothetical protein